MSSRVFRHSSILLLSAFLPLVAARAQPAAPTFAVKNHRLIMANGFVYLEFNEKRPSIDVLEADFSGQSHYGGNLLTTNRGTGAGIFLETIDADGTVRRSLDVSSHIRYKILRRDAGELSVSIQGIRDRWFHPEVISTWTLSLDANRRNFSLVTQTTVSHSRPVKAIELCGHFNQWFMNGLFQRGVMQYVNGCAQTFFTTNRLDTFYTMDNSKGSVAVVPKDSFSAAGWAMQSCKNNSGVGLETILAGDYPAKEEWSKASWPSAATIQPPAGAVFKTSVDIYPNDYSFPVYTVPADDPMFFTDLRTLYTATYGSSAGVLGSFEYDGSAYPTLATPKRPYGDMYTFFDPDSWAVVNTLSFSGDPYLQDQARRIVELVGSHIKHGQVPHHFIDGTPTYIAISKATQTGPNIFWVLAAIDYADGTGKEAWLREHYSQLKAATDWVLDCYDPDHKLVKVGGPLFIDVFIRQGYTLDSNAMLLHLLPEMSAVAQYCGDAASAARYSNLAEAIKQGMNAGLWNGQDHYITQRNADWSTRDLVDYDGNYAAIAFGAPTNQEQIVAMYRRLDGGPHTHPGDRGTWTSEKYYGPSDCTSGNTGDSATAMARIWWLDLDSRYVTGDVTNFYRYFEPVQDDLLQHTWLTERYNAQGKSIRAPYYHEYPEVTAMIQREMIYGIDVKINRIRLKPFGLDSYDYRVGDTEVSYSPNFVSLHIPGHNERTYEIHGLFPDSVYAISTGQEVTANHDGVVLFQAPAGLTITVQRVR